MSSTEFHDFFFSNTIHFHIFGSPAVMTHALHRFVAYPTSFHYILGLHFPQREWWAIILGFWRNKNLWAIRLIVKSSVTTALQRYTTRRPINNNITTTQQQRIYTIQLYTLLFPIPPAVPSPLTHSLLVLHPSGKKLARRSNVVSLSLVMTLSIQNHIKVKRIPR